MARSSQTDVEGTLVRVLLIGPPASGKGTQGRRIAAEFGVTYLSSGELLRGEVAAQTDLGRRVAGDLANGDLVPDEVILEVLREPLEKALKSGGYFLDGFPRTVAQARTLDAQAAEFGGAPEAAVWFDVADAELLRRTRTRALTEGRSDDVDAVARHRIDVYNAATAPLIDYYRQASILIHIDAAQPIDEVTAAVEAALAPFGVRSH
jgi:adenylate kinase